MSMSAKAIESALAMNAQIMEQAERILDLELELFELRAEITRLTPRALDRGDSAVEAALSTPEGYTGKAADTTPAPGK